MIEQELEEKLQKQVTRANKIIKGSLIGVLVLMLLMLVLIVFQLISIQTQQESNLQRMREAAAANHQRTQQYVKCVAEALTKPLAQREELQLETCTNKAAHDTADADNQGKL